ncbi:MAG: flavodoxin-dependent (E)-4-hydroxy-3-methylbut-2-enyl-diphosphate synthase [Lachnospiraceae bacterium]|nr:flavodoxin-dependent (E)-4-hydroxy-3-methylbut-2-enyl-diphosphate synthase [Lachnospiraceae bacterium]
MGKRRTKVVHIGNVLIGADNPIAVQSMTNTKTEDIAATVSQINELTKAGCDIVRVAVPNEISAEAISEIKKQITIPLVADIHFDYRLAIAAIEAGADKIRINPGNIGSKERIIAVVNSAKEHRIPIRIGVNSGSLEKHIVEKYGRVTAEGLAKSAMEKIKLMEECDFTDLVISMKSSDVRLCVKAHEILSENCPYPLHIGITEAGFGQRGVIKSAVGLGILLHKGIGDTVRVSLTGDPVEEIKVAHSILQDLGLYNNEIEVISCPTCARTEIDLITLARKVEDLAREFPLPIKLAVMGCPVNGPGEAKEADLGIAGGKGEALLLRKGEIIRKIPENEIIAVLREELSQWQQTISSK